MTELATAAGSRRAPPAWLSDELRPDVLLKSLSAGAFTFVLEIIVITSFAALIFSGSLSGALPSGLGFIIAGDAALCAVLALLSSYRGSIAIEQDAPSAVVAVGVATVVAALPAGTSPQVQFSTVLAMMIGTTFLSACLFLLLGGLRLGRLVRFLPFPVMGGFLAGTGWLLAIGAIGVMTDAPLSAGLFSPSLLMRWLPGVLFAVLLFFAASRFQGPMVLPAGVAVGLALFYLAAWGSGTPVSQLAKDGWLLGPLPTAGMWHLPIDGELLSQANWSVILSNWPQLASAAPISVIALLLNVSGLELVIRKDMAPDRELIAAGLGNLAAAFVGGVTGYHAISLSTLNHKMTAGKRLPALVIALLMALTIGLGAGALNYVPKLVLGALLFFVGLGLLFDWVYRAWFRFPKMDFLVIVLILGVIAARGFLDGIAAGLVLTILIFVVNYSQTRVVKHALTGKSYRSRATRGRSEQAILDRRGDEIYLLKLQGFVFFGTANTLVEQIRSRLGRSDLPTPRFILLDLAQVTGLDSTGLLCFERLLQLIEGRAMTLVIAGASSRIRRQFEKAGLQESPDHLEFCADLDHGIEQSENSLIASALLDLGEDEMARTANERVWPPGIQLQCLTTHMAKRQVAAGEYLIRQGEDPDLLYLIECGAVTAQLETPDKAPVRLETMRGGRSVGEIGFYLGIQRTAAVVADEDSTVYCLSRRDLGHLEQTDPEAASTLHHLIAYLLADRVVHLTRVVTALEQ